LFEGAVMTVMAERVIGYWRKYSKPPEYHTMDMFEDVIRAGKGESYRRIFMGTHQLLQNGFNADFVEDQIDEFHQQGRMKDSIFKAAEALSRQQSGSCEDAIEILKPMFESYRAKKENPHGYEAVRASDVAMRPLQWLWQGHLLRGAQEMTAGIPGSGKSQLQCALAACVTKGTPWPDGQRGPKPASVIMVTGEDCLDQVAVPRLLAAGADLNRVHFLKAIKTDAKSRSFLITEDVEKLEALIAEVGDVALVCIDPLTAFMGGGTNPNSFTEVRHQLAMLKELAEKTDVAISTITHPPKSGGQRAVDQFIGSQAFIAAVRISHVVVQEMTADSRPTGRMLYTHGPGNHKPMPTLAYRIEPVIVGKRPNQIETVKVVFEEQVELTADEALAAHRGTPRTTPVDTFLREALSEGERWGHEIVDEGKTAGFTKDQLKGARKRIGVKSRKIGLLGWKWSLPED
jgi:hypothetical protein